MVKYNIVILLFFCVTLGCNVKRNNGTNIRPQDFPSFIEAPENASNIRYAAPETANIIESACSLSYFIEEQFPPRSMMKYMHNELSSADFFPLKYSLYNLLMENGYAWVFDERLEPGYVYLEWSEEWIHKKTNESVSLWFVYRYKAGQQDLSKLHVNIRYHSEEAETAAFVIRYKKYYPEEEWEKKENEIDFGKILGKKETGPEASN